jgi:hypothetical protein
MGEYAKQDDEWINQTTNTAEEMPNDETVFGYVENGWMDRVDIEWRKNAGCGSCHELGNFGANSPVFTLRSVQSV